MGLLFNINNFLPQFLGFFPLYIGVELFLGFTIFNLAGGAYGIISIFTGHPINFWQWLYDVLALLSLPFFISALINLKNPRCNLRKMALISVLYTADTIITLFFMFYFIYFWFSREDKRMSTDADSKRSSVVADPSADQGQSASDTRELFIISSISFGVIVVRFYANLVMVGFTKSLLKQRDSGLKLGEGDEEDLTDPLPESRYTIIFEVKSLVRDLEERSLELIRDYIV